MIAPLKLEPFCCRAAALLFRACDQQFYCRAAALLFRACDQH